MEKENNLEKVGNFVSSTLSKIVNAIIVVLIIALVAVIGWFWHNNEIEKGKTEGLQKQVEDLKIELEEIKKERKDLETRKNEVEEIKSSEIKKEENVVKEEVVKNEDAQNNQIVRNDFYCEKDSDCSIKNGQNCCGIVPTCTNKNANFDEVNKKVRENCEKNGLASICGFEHIDGCKCVNNKCKSFQF